jgi:hypothetical protein
MCGGVDWVYLAQNLSGFFCKTGNLCPSESALCRLNSSSRAGVEKCETDRTERHDQVVNSPASYSGSPGFRSWPGDRLS